MNNVIPSSHPSSYAQNGSQKNAFMRFFWWLRSLMYLWVKSKSLPKKTKDLIWDPQKPVCYVLSSRSFTDLMVLDKHCEKLNIPRPLLNVENLQNANDGAYIYLAKSGLIQKQRGKAVPMGLFRLLQKVAKEERDVQLIPVSVFWGRDAGKEEKSLFKMLFFDDRQGGWLQRFILFFVQGRNVFCSFGKPISILEFVQREKELVSATKKLKRVLRVHFHRLRESMIGPYLYDHRQMVNTILHSKSMREFFDQEATKKGKSREKLEEQARRYIDEIAANLSPPVVRFADTILSWVFHKIYRGIEVQNGENIRGLAETHEIVYLPCHRSHMDYLLLGYSLYHLGVSPPHTAAGVNLNFWPIGAIFRRGGAFFIRRSFGGNKLYSAVFSEYVNFLLIGGYSMCFYMEGGRSRTGRLLQPKLGMISMVVKSFQEHSEKPIMLVPTYIAYDKLMEARTYFHELKGKTKKAESIWQLFRMPKLLAYEFGKAYINFGEPIDLKSYLLAQTPESSVSDTVVQLSRDVMSNINKAIYLNPVSLFSVALLALPKRGISEDELIEMTKVWIALLRAVPYDKRVIIPDLNARDLLKSAEALSQVRRFEHITGDVIFVNDSDRVFLNYYRNNSLPIFIIPSLIANVFSYYQTIDFEGLTKIVSESYALFKNDFFLKWNREDVLPIIQANVKAMEELKLLIVVGDQITCPPKSSSSFLCVEALGKVVGNVIERYCLYISLLAGAEEPVGTGLQAEILLDMGVFGKSCENFAKKLSILSGYHESDFFDKNEYKQFIDAMIDLGYIKKRGDQFQVLDRAKDCIHNLLPLSNAISRKLKGLGKDI